MHKRGLLNGSYWFTMYTTYFAILSLIFFVLENPDSPTAKDGVLKDAMEGKNTLAGLAKKSLAADRCSQSLNCLFKNLPELLKNRQSSVTPVNLKRPAPSSKPINPRPSIPADMRAPQRANTTPIQMMARAQRAEARPRSLDDGHAHRGHSRTHSDVHNKTTTPRWVPSTPDSAATETRSSTPSNTNFSTPSPIQQTTARRDASPAFQFPQQFANFNNVPDLMPIMFPSDDPFAYPTQPMSTLEDGHFSFEQQSGMPPTTTMAGNSNAMGLSIPTLENFSNLSLFANGTGAPPGMNPAMANRFANSQQPNPSRLQSPISRMSPSGEVVNSPDLVSIPNQNFMWQGYNFQPQNWTGDQHAQQAQPGQQPMPAPNGVSNVPTGIDENNPTGMGIDLGIPLDDIFGSNEAYRPAGNFNNEDWLQWMDVGN